MTWWVLLNVQTAIFCAAAAGFIYLRRPPGPLWPALFLVQGCALLWALGELGTIFAADLTWEQAALVVLYTGAIPLAAFWWLTALRFAEAHGIPFAWARPSVARAPLVIASLLWLAMLSNPLHGRFFTPVLRAPNEHHALWWAAVAFNYALILGVCALYAGIALRRRNPPQLRGQAAVLLAASSIPMLTTLSQRLFGPWPWPVDISLLGGWATSTLFLVAIYRGKLFDLSPIAVREVIRHDPNALLLLDPSKNLRFANPAAEKLLRGAPLVAGTRILDWLAPRLRRYRDSSSAVTPRDLWGELDTRHRGVAGRVYRFDETDPHWLWIAVTAVPGWRRAVAAYCVRIQDVTPLYRLERDRRELTAQLRRSERLQSLGTLAGGIAHEIREPVRSIMSAVHYAREALGDEDAEQVVDETLEFVMREAERCSRVSDGVLRFARNESSEKWPGDINDCVLNARERTLAVVEEEHDARIDLDLGDDLPPIDLHPTEVKQVFVNLILNAAEAGGAETRIQIRSEATVGGVRVIVSDDGPGMTPEECARAFEPFFTRRHHRGGTGLGLSVVHGIVMDHDGKIQIDSRPGEGTRVILEFPAAGAFRDPGFADLVTRERD